MSDTQDVATNILLPAARVAFFVLDEDLRQTVEELKQDWRFARVTFDVHEGDVETAVETFRTALSPNLVIVETAEIEDSFTGRLEVLAGNCSEDTAAVVVGPVNDVYLYRKLIDMGVSDYLVRPVQKKILSELIAKVLIEKLGVSESRLIAYVGAKGGIGTSWIAQSSASVLAEELGEKTVILDAAGGRSYLSVAMGTDVVTTLHEAARASSSADQDSFKRMVVGISDNLSVLATGAESILDDPVSSEQFETIVNKLMSSYSVVIVDLSSAPIAISRSVITRAHDVVIVSSPTLPALRSARGLLQEVKTLRGGADQGSHLVLNMKGITQGHDVSDSDISNAMKVETELDLSWAPKVFFAAESSGKGLDEINGGKEVLAEIRKFLVNGLRFADSGSSTPKDKASSGSLLGGLLSKKKSK